MKQIVLCGYGQMGKLMYEALNKCPDMKIAMIADRSNESDLYRLSQPADLLIDFSHPGLFALVKRYVQYSGCALLSGTTGLQEDQMAGLYRLAQDTRVMYAPNYSLGIALMLQAVKRITPYLADDFDMEIIETHHSGKQDAPSGTAKQLLKAMDPHCAYQEINGRCGMGKRGREIGVHALRGGNMAGEHTVLYLGEDEKLEIKHTAISRKIFVNGAMKAAYWLLHQEIGFYTMEDMVGG